MMLCRSIRYCPGPSGRYLRLAPLLLALVFATGKSLAQQEPAKPAKTNEFWGGINSLEMINVDLTYKRSLDGQTFFRFALSDLSAGIDGSSSGSETHGRLSFSGAIALGIEFRPGVERRWLFFHGPSITVGYSQQESSSITSGKHLHSSQRAGAYYSLGIMASLGKGFYLAGELRPNFYYSVSESKNGSAKNSSYNYGFLISDLLLFSVAYRL